MSNTRAIGHEALARAERYDAFLFACGGVMLEVHLAWERFPGPRKYRMAIREGEDALFAALRAEEARVIADALEICAPKAQELGRLPSLRECRRALRTAARRRRYRVGRFLLFLVYVRTPLDAVPRAAGKPVPKRRNSHARNISGEASRSSEQWFPGYDTY